MTLDEFVTGARALRAEADRAEDRLMRFLLDAEQDPQVTEGTGLVFLELIKRENIVEPTRYVRWKRVTLGLGSAADGVGVEALVAAGGLADEAAQRNVIARAKLFEESNGTTISAQSAERLARDEKMRDAGVRAPGGYSQLLAECQRLRERVAGLEQENVALRAEVKRLTSEARKVARRREARAS